MAFCVRLLDAQLDRAAFDCGEPALNTYLQRYASQDVRRGVAKVFVASPAAAPRQVAGFYALSAASVAAETLPPMWAQRLPRYPVPVALLGRLAVDRAFQGQGLGAALLVDACRRVWQASHTLAVAALVADAKSEQAAGFYRRFGFEPLPGCPNRWMLPLKTIAAIAQSGPRA